MGAGYTAPGVDFWKNSLLEINYIGVFPERLYSVHAAFFRQEYMRHEVKPVDDNPSAVGIIVSAYCFHSEFFQGFFKLSCKRAQVRSTGGCGNYKIICNLLIFMHYYFFNNVVNFFLQIFSNK